MITIKFPIEFRTINGDQEVEVNESSSTLAADIDFKHNFIHFHFFIISLNICVVFFLHILSRLPKIKNT